MPTTRQPTGGTSEAAGRGPGAHQPQPPGSTDEGAGPVPAPVPAPEGRPGVAGRAVLARAGRRPMLGYQCVSSPVHAGNGPGSRKIRVRAIHQVRS